VLVWMDENGYYDTIGQAWNRRGMSTAFISAAGEGNLDVN